MHLDNSMYNAYLFNPHINCPQQILLYYLQCTAYPVCGTERLNKLPKVTQSWASNPLWPQIAGFNHHLTLPLIVQDSRGCGTTREWGGKMGEQACGASEALAGKAPPHDTWPARYFILNSLGPRSSFTVDLNSSRSRALFSWSSYIYSPRTKSCMYRELSQC